MHKENQNVPKINKQLKELLNEDLLHEMSNFRKYITGLPVNISLQIETDEEKHYQHNLPKLKFQNNNADRITSRADLIPVSIDPINPKVLIDKPYNKKYFKAVRQWIINNYDALMQFWHQEIDEFQLKARLKGEK